MSSITLLQKAPRSFQLNLFGEFLESTLGDLDVEWKICGTTSRGWVQIAVSGEDEKIVMNYLAKEVGICPERLEDVEKFSILKGCVTALSQSKDAVHVDVGVFSPHVIDATVPLRYLHAQLVDGRKVALKRVIELFGFGENLPLTVKVLNVNGKEKLVEAMLAEKQVRLIEFWTKSLLDRLIVLGCTLNDVESALAKAQCYRDIAKIESLGFFEHAVVCKLGTDAVGLIPRIGKSLKAATFYTFKPKKILEFLA